MEQSVLNTKKVKDEVEKLGVTTLVVDWTDKNQEIGDFIQKLGANFLPVLAFFPSDNPNQPIVLKDGWYTQNDVLASLNKAGASKNANTTTLASNDQKKTP